MSSGAFTATLRINHLSIIWAGKLRDVLELTCVCKHW